MKDSFYKDFDMDMESKLFQIKIYMKEIGLIIKKMDKVNMYLIHQVRSYKDNLKMMSLYKVNGYYPKVYIL